MPIPIPDYDTVVEPQVLAFWRNRYPGKDTHTESFLGKGARALGRTIMYFFSSLQSVDNDAVPGQNTSRAALNNMAFAYGLPSNLGGYGPNGATAATGGVGACTGTPGTTFTDGSTLVAPDGVTIVKLSGSVTTPAGSGQTSINGNFVAVTLGSAGNLGVGTVLAWQNPPSGAVGTVTLSSPLTGALNTETNQALLARILARWQSPPKGGARQDYRTWAESVSGVLRAYVYPRRQGTGTVDVVITAGGSGAGRAPSAATQTAVNNYVNGSLSPFNAGQRPVTASAYRTLLPYIAASGLAVRVRVTPSQTKYAFDWALGAGSLTTASYNAGTGVLTTNEALPASLTQAVDAYLASPSTVSPPRLQVISTGMASPIPPAVSVINYNVGAKTLTLQLPTPGAWAAPSANDPIYPYGPAVPIVAAGLLAYVDGLGPSRASGYANELDVWDDTCRLFSLGQVALDATDSDGVTRPIKSVPSGGVTINGATADVEATDDANGVQLLTAKSVAVTD